MKRDILFRGKTEEGKWIEGYSLFGQQVLSKSDVDTDIRLGVLAYGVYPKH